MASAGSNPPPPVARPASWSRLLVGVGLLLAAACATPTAAGLRAGCESGSQPGSCSEWGHELLAQGEKQQAENAFARACEAGSQYDCLYQGKLMLERGEVAAAEPPLRTAYEAELEEATWALADLHQTRGDPGDLEAAEHLRFEAPAIDKPAREFTFWWRPTPSGEPSFAFAYTFQPMLFFSRRMTLGVQTAFDRQGATELNAAVGYQHYLTSELVPYGTLLLGGAFQERSFNAGGELGLKWCLGPVGHLNLAVGSSVASPFHASVGIGVNALFVELLVLLAASR